MARYALYGVVLLAAGLSAYQCSLPSRDAARQVFQQAAYGDAEAGVRRMRDGTVEVACYVTLPGLSADMFHWWIADYLQTTEHYKLWHPKDHLWMAWEHKQPGAIVGAHHLVHETIGGELSKLRIQFVAPDEVLGYDPSNDHTRAICAHAGELETDMNFADMCHVVRDTPWGAELRSRFWLGVVSKRDASGVENALLSIAANNPVSRRFAVDETFGLSLLKHCTEEMSYLAELLPKIYPEASDHERP